MPKERKISIDGPGDAAHVVFQCPSCKSEILKGVDKCGVCDTDVSKHPLNKPNVWRKDK